MPSLRCPGPSARWLRPVMGLLVLCLLAACGNGALRPPSDGTASTAAGSTSVSAGITTYSIPPSAPDPGTTGPDRADLALAGPASSWNGRLLVFLPGSGAGPSCCRDLLAEAASMGFHVIGLTYNNSVSVASRCGADLVCYGEVRRNLFDGGPRGAHSSVGPRDTIQHRLVAVLSYLNALHPHGGWAPYLLGNRDLPDYSRLVLAGHAQGGGEAAYIATRVAVRGVVLLSSPSDASQAGAPAPWLDAVRAGAATPVARFFAFAHLGDALYPRQRADWTAMGLDALGGAVSVDTSAPPYGGAHELLSDAPLPAVAQAAHDATALDAAVPRCPNGTPRYAPVWRYLLRSAAGLPPAGSGRGPGC